MANESAAARTELINAFKEIPTGNLSDAMDGLGLARGVVHGLKPLSLQQPRTVGFAFTLKQMPRHQEAVGKTLTKHAQVIDSLASPGDVLVIDVGGRLDVCSGGALLSLRSKMRGLCGWIVNGCVRDVQEIVELGFPVHCCGTSPIKSSPDMETVGLELPLEIGGVQIKTGDLIVADDTGIVVIPLGKAAAVLEAARHIKQVEEKLAALLRAGLSYPEARKQSET
jgi:regulator of RNase E activity RraA